VPDSTSGECVTCPHGCSGDSCNPECNPDTDACCDPDGTLGDCDPTHIKINCGGDDVADVDGDWVSGDNYVSGGDPYHYGETHDVSDVQDPAPAAVYEDVHHRDHTYNIPVPSAGSYTVRIHFTEGYPSSATSRAMKYTIEGMTVLDDFNIYAAAGNQTFKVVIEEFSIGVVDGMLEIVCEEGSGHDVFEAAIEVIGP
jgi:hypothetical protein